MSLDNSNFGSIVALKGGSIQRYAYPAYKVYIFGKDVTADVVEVRVSHSGGSAERSPGGCSITMVNVEDSYTITYDDMFAIAQSKAAFSAYAESKIKSYMDHYLSSSILDRSFDYHFDTLLEESAILSYSERMDELGLESTVYSDKLEGYKNSYVEDIEALKKAHADIKKHVTGDGFFNWEDYVRGKIKAEVLRDKLISVTAWTEMEQDSNLLVYRVGEVNDYPIQQGDCVFHPNDPIRIAFRDPFDPRVWYWMFAGFVDTFTESSGENMESYITITGTDVTKSARYSMVQMSTGLLDQDVGKTIEGFEASTSIGLTYFDEIFAHFTVYEALETLFFGSESAISGIEETTLRHVATMTEDEKKVYLATNRNMTEGDINSLISQGVESVNKKVTEFLLYEKKNRLQGFNFPPVVAPAPYMFRGDGSSFPAVPFKRKSEQRGIHAYFFGDLDQTDKLIGEELPDLHSWNKMLHHVITPDDLEHMVFPGETPASGAFYTSKNMIEQVIHEIGTNIKKYPVGGGHVYYVAPSKLSSELGENLIDRGLGGMSATMHSLFKDRLSFMYDISENIDFRFYATPRGDVVFEMPFYDFDPEDFWGGEQIDSSNKWDEDLDNIYYDNLIRETYEGNYKGVVNDLTKMVVELSAARSDYDWIDFSKDFPEYDFRRAFIIEEHEQYGYSITATDEGVLTAYRATPAAIAGQKKMSQNLTDIQHFEWAYNRDHIKMLGLRVGTGSTWGFIDSKKGAQSYSAFMMRRINAEARNMSVQTIPNYGIMVNRPAYWRKKNYSANVVSTTHSISWASSCETNINLNQIRGWVGKVENGIPVREHFMGEQPYNLATLLKKNRISNEDEKKG